jgi:hypothetical protein
VNEVADEEFGAAQLEGRYPVEQLAEDGPELAAGQ